MEFVYEKYPELKEKKQKKDNTEVDFEKNNQETNIETIQEDNNYEKLEDK